MLTRHLIFFRYKKPADWELLSSLAEKHTVPLIGNGDILTYYEVHRHPLLLKSHFTRSRVRLKSLFIESSGGLREA